MFWMLLVFGLQIGAERHGIFKLLSAFLKELATRDSYSSFSMDFIRQQCHSFLQSHRNPVLKSPKNARYHQTVFAPDISIF